MRTYLSFGAGVNSVALMLWLIDNGIEAESVFADHGADWPETYEYVAMLQGKGYPITVLKARRKTTKADGSRPLALYDYYYHYRITPIRMQRHCTVEFKLKPLHEYMQVPCIEYIGISADEAHRVDRLLASQREGGTKLFPLVDEGIDRKGCIEIIEAHGLPVPIKSGCFICPFQRRSQWVNLRTRHPDLYCKAKRLEDNCNRRLAEQGRPPMYLALDRPLDAVCEADQMDLFGEREDKPCLCML